MRALLALVFVLPLPLGAQSPGMLVSPEWVEQRLGDEAVVLLHADMRRTRYEEGHIPGARFLDLSALVWEGDPPWGAEMRTPAEIDGALEAAGVSDGQHIVLYSGNALFAGRAWMTLDVMGVGDRISILDGGLGGWTAAGRPVTSEEPAVTRGSVRLWRASYTHFAARLPGYDARFYDGSGHDWGTREGYPYEGGRDGR